MEIYSQVVPHGITPDYFFDQMTIPEVNAICENIKYQYRLSWEQTRFISYITACTVSNKIKKPEDLVRFAWEKPVEISQEEFIARGRELIDNYNSINTN